MKENINSIHGGISQTLNQGEEGSYIGARAIDPDEIVDGRISGTISPTSYAKFSSTKDVVWFEPNDKDDKEYYYTNKGEFGYVDETITKIADIADSKGNGLKYYNNYYYIIGNKDIHRYGPLDGTPALELNWWTKIPKGDLVIQGVGDGKEIAHGGITKISQSFSGAIEFKKIVLGLKNTGTDTDYKIKITAREKTTTPLYLKDGATNFFSVAYNLDTPSGDTFATAIINAPTNTETLTEIEFDKVVSWTDGGTLVIETEEALEANQSFEVTMAKFGDKYTGMLAEYDASWDIVQPITFEDDITDKQGKGVLLTHEIETKDEGTIIGNTKVSFVIAPLADTTGWDYRVRINGSNISTTHVSLSIYSSGTLIKTVSRGDVNDTDVESTVANYNVVVTIKPSAKLKHGDEIEIFTNSIDAEGAVDGKIKYISSPTALNAPYVYFTDTSKAEDIGIRILGLNTEHRELGNEEYPIIDGYELPNHMAYIHGGSVYLLDKQREGLVHKITTGSSMRAYISGTLAVGDIIRGKNSTAIATVAIVEKTFEL